MGTKAKSSSQSQQTVTATSSFGNSGSFGNKTAAEQSPGRRFGVNHIILVDSVSKETSGKANNDRFCSILASTCEVLVMPLLII